MGKTSLPFCATLVLAHIGLLFAACGTESDESSALEQGEASREVSEPGDGPGSGLDSGKQDEGALEGAAGIGSDQDQPSPMGVCDWAPGTPDELALTPREERRFEEIARNLTGDFVTDSATYQRVVADMRAFAELDPRTASVAPFSGADGLLLQMPRPAFEEMQRGDNDLFACLNEQYGATVTFTPLDALPTDMVVLRFEGVFDLAVLEGAYAELPDVQVDLNSLTYIEPPPGVAVRSDGETWTYIFSFDGDACPGPVSNCRERSGATFVSQPDGTRTIAEEQAPTCTCNPV